MTRTAARTRTAPTGTAGASPRTIACIDRLYGIEEPPPVDETVEAADDIMRELASFRAFLNQWDQWRNQ